MRTDIRDILLLHDKKRNGSRNVDLHAVQPPDTAANPRMFYYIYSPRNS
jgi:hypothetical protein